MNGTWKLTNVALGATSAIVVLAVGALIYLSERDPARVWLMPAGWSIASLHGVLPAVVRDNGPSFVHAYAFSVLTALCQRPTRNAAGLACFFWFTVDALFEAGQHAALSGQFAASLPAWSARVPMFDHLGGYFVAGNFDLADLIASALGAFAAGATLLSLRSGRWSKE